jgi:hypothetical protein
LLDAEAAPEVVARGTRVERESVLGPRGELEVRVLAPAAQVYLDDVPRGAAPARLRAAIGRHVLRVEAPGYLTYGAFIDVLEGARPAFVVQPSASPELAHARLLARDAQYGEYVRLVEHLASIAQHGDALGDVLVLETNAHTPQRALLVACAADGCRRALRIDARDLPAALPAPRLEPARLLDDRAWLAGASDAARATTTPWWQRWYVWGPLAALAAGATAVVLSSGESQPARHLHVVVDPGGVGQ